MYIYDDDDDDDDDDDELLIFGQIYLFFCRKNLISPGFDNFRLTGMVYAYKGW